MMKLKIIKELNLRWQAKSPIFWQKILKLAVTLTTSAIAVLTADMTFNLVGYGVPEFIFKLCGYIVAFGSALGLASKLTIE